MAVSPRYCAENKVQTGSAAAGGHRRVATRETTGDLATRRGAGDPGTRAEWMKVSRYGHLRSAPVVVNVGVRTEWEPPTLRAALCCLHVPSLAPPRWLPASPLTGNQCVAVARVKVQNFRERFRVLLSQSGQSPEVHEEAAAERAFPRNVDFPLVYALSGCTRHCATLFHQGAGASRCVPKEPDRLFSTTSRICKNAHFPTAGLDGSLTVSRPWRHPKFGFSCLLSAHSRC